MSHTTAARRVSRLLLGACSVAALAACNTSPKGGGTTPPPPNKAQVVDLGTPEVLGPLPPTPPNYGPKQFPALFINAEDTGGTDAQLSRGYGTGTSQQDNLSSPGNIVTINIGSKTVTLTSQGGGTFLDGGGVIYRFFTFGEYSAWVIDDPSVTGMTDFAAGFGYQMASLPNSGTATYATNTYGRLVLAEDAAGGFITLVNDNAGGITLDADLLNSTVSGTLFTGNTLIDADGVGGATDALNVTTTLAGANITGSRISGGTVSGTVSVNAQPGTLTMTDTGTNGAFYLFGPNQYGSIATAYDGRYDASEATSGLSSTGAFVGYTPAQN